nr:hypothetical protein [Tanacetum cinerariifolium]
MIWCEEVQGTMVKKMMNSKMNWRGIPLMDAYEFDPEAHEVVPQSLNQAPLSPAHALVYLKYLAPSDDDLEPAEAQPLHASVSLTALSLNYSVDFELVEEDHEEDPKEEPFEEKDEELSDPTDS